MRRARAAGDAALLVDADGDAVALAAAIRDRALAGVLDVIPAARTVLITIEPGSRGLGELASAIRGLPLAPAAPGAAATVVIPVSYDGADLGQVSALTGLPAQAVIALHAGAQYTVGWMGFCPGFGYLTGLDPALAAVPRLARPRLSVPAGAVAIAGGLAAVYPAASPGGWRLLGRTCARLWDPRRDPPALLAPGMRVRFQVTERLAAGPETPDVAGTGGTGPGGGAGAGTGRTGDQAERAVLEVIRPGPLATIQDLGRPGHGHLGVPASGAADPASLRLANRLARNPDGAAGLELTLGRARLRFLADAVVAAAGAPVSLTVTAGPGAAAGAAAAGARPGLPAAFGAAFGVAAGSVLAVGSPAAGLRSYLAVRGGIGGPPVLGSRSSDLLSGLGPSPLRPGDLLTAGDAPLAGTGGRDPADHGPPGRGPAGRGPVASRLPPADEPAVLRVIAGPRADWFSAGALRILTTAEYTVTPASNRSALRLDGPGLPRAGGGELPSEGIATGSVQAPADGRPILMLADHPVTGGYPVIAVLHSADIGLAAQLRPGQRLRFALSW